MLLYFVVCLTLLASSFLHACMLSIHSLSLEEGDVEEGRVEVDKLEQVHLADEAVVVFSLGSMELWRVGEETD